MVGTPSAEKRGGVKRAERLCPPWDWCRLPCAGGAQGGLLPMCATLCPLPVASERNHRLSTPGRSVAVSPRGQEALHGAKWRIRG